MTPNDLEFLKHYSPEACQEAFAAQVHHHRDPRDAAALRPVRSPQRAAAHREDAPQSRVGRAAESWLLFCSRHGRTVGASGLIAALSAHTVSSAPVGLGAALSTGAMASSAALHATIATMKGLAMTTM